MVLVGMAKMQIEFETYDIIRSEVELFGFNGGTKEDVAAEDEQEGVCVLHQRGRRGEERPGHHPKGLGVAGRIVALI